jgi:hypothetical protein
VIYLVTNSFCFFQATKVLIICMDYVGSQIEQRGQSGAEAGRSAVRTVRGGGADGPRAQSQLGFLVSRGICYLKPRD